MKKLGIAGGLGPLASALFFERVTSLTRVSTDQEHIETVLYSAPAIPDRSAFLTGKSTESPLPGLIQVCRILEHLTDIIAIPCVTAYHFYDELSGAVSIPVVDMHCVCAEALRAQDVTAVGLMATDGTVRSGRLQSVLHSHGINAIVPDKQDAVMRLIYDTKVGKAPDMELFGGVTEELLSRGAEKILLACTELSVFAETGNKNPTLCDALEILALYCVSAAGGTPVD